jgi:hypothetical protein
MTFELLLDLKLLECLCRPYKALVEVIDGVSSSKGTEYLVLKFSHQPCTSFHPVRGKPIYQILN